MQRPAYILGDVVKMSAQLLGGSKVIARTSDDCPSCNGRSPATTCGTQSARILSRPYGIYALLIDEAIHDESSLSTSSILDEIGQ
jgi:hypothetical protein